MSDADPGQTPGPEQEWTPAEAGAAIAEVLGMLENEPGPWRVTDEALEVGLRRLEGLDG
jgi:hypothetical protein